MRTTPLTSPVPHNRWFAGAFLTVGALGALPAALLLSTLTLAGVMKTRELCRFGCDPEAHNKLLALLHNLEPAFVVALILLPGLALASRYGALLARPVRARALWAATTLYNAALCALSARDLEIASLMGEALNAPLIGGFKPLTLWFASLMMIASAALISNMISTCRPTTNA